MHYRSPLRPWQPPAKLTPVARLVLLILPQKKTSTFYFFHDCEGERVAAAVCCGTGWQRLQEGSLGRSGTPPAWRQELTLLGCLEVGSAAHAEAIRGAAGNCRGSSGDDFR